MTKVDLAPHGPRRAGAHAPVDLPARVSAHGGGPAAAAAPRGYII